MKILSWNINGIRASKVDLKALFDSLDADVICLQETKVTRDQLDEPTAIVEGYNSYFSFSRKRSGYSGVANICRDTATPTLAEEGLTCLLNPKEEGKIGCYGDTSEFPEDELESLDAEGRAIITQHKIRQKSGEEEDLAIINVYCPRVDPEREDRQLYKMRFLALLQTRAEALLQAGRHVVVLGDLNLNHKLIDNCDPDVENFGKHPARMWMNQFLWLQGRDPDIQDIGTAEDFTGTTPAVKGGLFVDTFRHLYPEQKDAYTNWCTLTSARETNYGRRLDYILTDVAMVKCALTESVIMASVEGSDHCPVKSEFSCTYIPAQKCPPLCTKYMPEFAGKQQKLSQFFTKQTLKKAESITTDIQDSTKPVLVDDSDKNGHVQSHNDTKKRHASDHREMPCMKKQKQETKKGLTKQGSGLSKQSSGLSKQGSGVSKQASLMNFFGKSSGKLSKPSLDNHIQMDKCEEKEQKPGAVKEVVEVIENGVSQETRSDESDSPPSSQESTSDKPSKPSSALAWKNLLKGPPTAPLCKGHNEPCLLRTVKKEGPNKGKQFFVCNRPEGHSSNPEARCDFFKWVDRSKS